MRITPLGIYGPYPAPGGACSSTLVEWSGGAMLLDAGSGALSRLAAKLPPSALVCAVLTHLHYDHMSDMLPLSYALAARAERLPVYCPDAPESVRALLAAGPFELIAREDVELAGLRLSFGPARHPVPARSVRIEADGTVFVHTGDTNSVDGLAEFARDADLLMADAGLPEAVWSDSAPHLSPRLCGELALASGAKRLLLTHLRPDRAPGEALAEARAVFPSACLAVENETITL